MKSSLTFDGRRGDSGFSTERSDSQSEICGPLSFSTSPSDASRSLSVSMAGKSSEEGNQGHLPAFSQTLSQQHFTVGQRVETAVSSSMFLT